VAGRSQDVAIRDLSTVDYVYLWTDGVHLGVRLDEEKLCLLVMIGVRVDGTKELIAVAEGHRESTGSWVDLLRDCARRGMRAPTLAIGDGALGFWAALREVFPTAREQRCWFDKIGNVLSALPKSAHPCAKRALAEIWNAEDREHARRAVAAFKLAYGDKFGKAVAKITDDLDELLDNLILAEDEFTTDEAARSILPPPQIVAEVTDDTRFTGGSLVQADRADLLTWLAEYGINPVPTTPQTR
jgi:transposase-like protein